MCYMVRRITLLGSLSLDTLDGDNCCIQEGIAMKLLGKLNLLGKFSFGGLVVGTIVGGCTADDVGTGAFMPTDNDDGGEFTPGCGNGVLEDAEQCDVADLGAATCESVGFSGGVLRCRTNCTYDTLDCTAPPNCGNGTLDAGEECDGNQLGSSSCGSKGFAQGTIACNANCTLDTTSCFSCGNGLLEGPEVCDGNNMGSESCESRQHDGGPLACGANCLEFDESSCTDCGDGSIDQGEDCEPSVELTDTCESLGFSSGTVSCDSSCRFETNECQYACSDGIDNDDDGYLDFPGDPGCTSADDNDELVFADECDNIATDIIDITTEADITIVADTLSSPAGFAGTCASGATGGSAIFLFHSRTDQTVNFDLGHHVLGFPDLDYTNYDTVLYVREATCTGLEVACNDDKTLFVDVASEVTVALKADTDYFVFVGGYSAGTFGMEIDVPEAQ